MKCLLVANFLCVKRRVFLCIYSCHSLNALLLIKRIISVFTPHIQVKLISRFLHLDNLIFLFCRKSLSSDDSNTVVNRFLFLYRGPLRLILYRLVLVSFLVYYCSVHIEDCWDSLLTTDSNSKSVITTDEDGNRVELLCGGQSTNQAEMSWRCFGNRLLQLVTE